MRLALKHRASGTHRSEYTFVPLLDFSKKWTDEDLYKKYGLSDSEIGFINSIVKPLEW